ncbi:MAG: rhomboid family intramembrane serine protease [Bradymonadia bacterium]
MHALGVFLLVPLGHDREVYDRPYVTWAVAAVCALVLVVQSVSEDRRVARIDAHLTDLDTHITRVKEANVGAEFVETLDPWTQEWVVEGLTVVDGPGDTRVEEIVASVDDEVRRQPFRKYGLVPARVRPTSLVSHAFLHGDWLHLLGNGIFLLVVGGLLECFWRRSAYIGLFLGAAIGGGVLHVLTHAGSSIPLVGASGAISGLMAAFVVGFGSANIHLGYFVWVLRVFAGSFWVPAYVFFPAWIGLDVLRWWLGGDSGVSYAAHIGGFAVGLGLAFLAKKYGWIAVDAGRDVARDARGGARPPTGRTPGRPGR